MADKYKLASPMRIMVKRGSVAEARYKTSALPQPFPRPTAIAPGIDPAPLEDLIFHGGKIVPRMTFQNIYCGSSANWAKSDVTNIDAAILAAMREPRLNNVIAQYFHKQKVSCDPHSSIVLEDPAPQSMDEPDVQDKVVSLFKAKKIPATNLDSTIFNLLLPKDSVLALGDATSKNGLGGYHGSVHFTDNGHARTLYYSASVFSEGDNGITAFDTSWKNVVATLYHELNEFRTDADVTDAIEKNSNDFLGWMSRGGRECGDEPIAVAARLDEVFQEVLLSVGSRIPVQFLYSNVVHGPEGPVDSSR